MPPIRQSSSHRLCCLACIEFFGIKFPSPLHKIIVLFVIRVIDGFEELGVAPDTTNVFWWAVPFAFDTKRITVTFLGLEASVLFAKTFGTFCREYSPLSL